MYFKDINSKTIHLNLAQYHTRYDMYYAFYKKRFNVVVPKYNVVNDTAILNYLNDDKLFSL